MAAPATQFNENASPIHFSEKYKSFLENLSAADIPPLPAIPEDLKKTASTHLSAHGRKTQDFDDKDPEAFNADYEHMEFIGDSLVSMAATSLIQQRYPRLTVSRMTVSPSLELRRWIEAHTCYSTGPQDGARLESGSRPDRSRLQPPHAPHLRRRSALVSPE